MKRHRHLRPRRAVGATNATRDDLVCGINPVREMLRAAPQSLRRIVAARGARSTDEIVGLARAAGVQIEIADAAVLDELARGEHHQGVVAEAAPFAYTPLDAVLANRPRLLVALDGIMDPQNLGAIIRSAEVLGAGALILPRDRAASVTPAAIRASSGATAHLPVCQVVNLVRALEIAKEGGYWVVALDPNGPSRLSDVPFLERAVLVVGGEGEGVRRLVLETADFRAAIPVAGRVESLNAASAAAIGLYSLTAESEARRGRS